MEGVIGHWRDFNFYSEYWKAVGGFRTEECQDLIYLQQDHFDCYVENRLRWGEMMGSKR